MAAIAETDIYKRWLKLWRPATMICTEGEVIQLAQALLRRAKGHPWLVGPVTFFGCQLEQSPGIAWMWEQLAGYCPDCVGHRVIDDFELTGTSITAQGLKPQGIIKSWHWEHQPDCPRKATTGTGARRRT